LNRISAAPDSPMHAIEILEERERQTIASFGCASAAWPVVQSIVALFEAPARQRPRAVAVEYEGQQLNYGELERRANQLAQALRQRGVGPETPVGLCVERSLDMVVGLLGILKAGAAYLPLDPDYPAQRLAFMLEDAGAQLVLAH